MVEEGGESSVGEGRGAEGEPGGWGEPCWLGGGGGCCCCDSTELGKLPYSAEGEGVGVL